MAPTDEFLNTYEEVHVLWYGLLEAFNLFAPQCIPTEARDDLWEELHYFWLGLGIGAVLQCFAGALLIALITCIVGGDLWWMALAGVSTFLLLTLVWTCIIGPAKKNCIIGIWVYEHIDLFEFEERFGPYSRRLSDTVDDIYLANLREAREESALWDDEDDDEGQAAYQ